MSLSTHKVEVVPIKLFPHGNADSLSIVYPFGEDGYTCIVKTADWQDQTMGAYVPPDSIVPDTPEYAFLEGHRRIRVKRYRGILSQGLMVKAPEGSDVGDDVAKKLGITHWNPGEPGETDSAPKLKLHPRRPTTFKGWFKFIVFSTLRYFGIGQRSLTPETEVPFTAPVYDVDSLFRYPHVLQEGEEVIATEKIDGSNGRWVCIDGILYAGSHYQWKKQGANAWWQMYDKYPELKKFVTEHPGVVVYGEVYGVNIQKDMPYGLPSGDIRFRAFDLWSDGRYFDIDHAHEMAALYKFPWVNQVYRGTYNAKAMIELGSKLTSTIAENSHVFVELAEGIVVRPIHERYDRRCGRVILKVVSPEYLDKHEPKRNKKKKV